VIRAMSALSLLLLVPTGWGQTAPPAPPQEPDQTQPAVTTIKMVTRLVAISAVVTGKDGEAKEGLTKDDFVLKQDGKEQPISFFSRGSDLPLSLALMVDTSASQQTFIGDESIASDVFFETMLGGKDDRAMLVEFNSAVLQLKGMTNSTNALHLALTHLNPSAPATGGTLLNDAVYVVAKNVLAGETGRKAMVILTDGGDNGSRRSLTEAIEQAQRADVQIYSILYSMYDDLSNTAAGHLPGGDPGLGALQKLSESTGGRVFTVSRTMSLREIYAQIGQDLRLQYELGYKPPPSTQPNSYHKLELKAKDKKLRVQARKGFFEAP
jgi:Ca-activated chloride channel family protein